ncbi:helix-turn-helix domain-containing protein [Endozoicomonas euniceicola]|uniref:Helix-turn-helix domain-containing protein n=1 Tax=Endozoicomonas euniceicola TaxID=1234143 RepID=A0ABY6H0N4_9GAMM|nr:helix-turn-helix transcriptional regulator [Endozoicomonas euniceicola]UYM18612.1 helix-turn-helix domain-containing protein [Endozoicomonas euniceicola]
MTHSFDSRPCTTLATILSFTLRQFRIDEGFSKRAFADRLNISPTAWGKIENGDSVISLQTLNQIHQRFWERPSAFFICAESCAHYLSNNGWEILSKLPEEDSDSLAQYAKEYFTDTNDSKMTTGRTGRSTSILTSRWIPNFIEHAVCRARGEHSPDWK